MKSYFLAGITLLLCLVFTPTWAADVSHRANLANFQAICLKSSDLCRYILLDFLADGVVDTREVDFLPLHGRGTVAFWNHHVRRATRASTHVDVSTYDAHARKWDEVTTSKECPLCVPGTLRNDPSKQWVRFETDHQAKWRVPHSFWSFERIVAHGAHTRTFVVVKSLHGPVVYASVRNSNMHYHYSTAQTGGFRVLLESGWVPSARPDFVVISPVESWSEVARAYMRAQASALTGENRLPVFTGSPEHIIDEVVHYIASQDIRYSDSVDIGGYPSQNVADILAERRTDCKGFATLLDALLGKSGLKAEPVLLNAYGMPPLSFGVPDTWFDHVMVYVPVIRRYIDLTVSLPSDGKFTWRTSANSYTGDVVLNTVTGRFDVVPPVGWPGVGRRQPSL